MSGSLDPIPAHEIKHMVPCWIHQIVEFPSKQCVRPLHIYILSLWAIFLDAILGLAGESWSPVRNPGFSKVFLNNHPPASDFRSSPAGSCCNFLVSHRAPPNKKHCSLLDASDSQVFVRRFSHPPHSSIFVAWAMFLAAIWGPTDESELLNLMIYFCEVPRIPLALLI